jgi:hypothetical protein
VLVECGFVRAIAEDGSEWTFTPSLANIASLGNPGEIVALYARLHGPFAEGAASYVLACLCDQEDPLPLIGGFLIDPCDPTIPVVDIPALMPAAELVIIARHLMQHGIIGKARPGRGDGNYAETFEAAEYIAAARVHLGMSAADAEALSMTELQLMLEMKFPDSDPTRDVPSREEYDRAMAAIMSKRHV